MWMLSRHEASFPAGDQILQQGLQSQHLCTALHSPKLRFTTLPLSRSWQCSGTWKALQEPLWRQHLRPMYWGPLEAQIQEAWWLHVLWANGLTVSPIALVKLV